MVKSPPTLAHSTIFPWLGNQDLRALQDLITAEKRVTKSSSKLSADFRRAAEALNAWGLHEGNELQETIQATTDLFERFSEAMAELYKRLSGIRMHLKEIRGQEENNDQLKASQAKISSPDPTVTEEAERNLYDFKNKTGREWLGKRFAALLECCQKGVIIGEEGKRIASGQPHDLMHTGAGLHIPRARTPTTPALPQVHNRPSLVQFKPLPTFATLEGTPAADSSSGPYAEIALDAPISHVTNPIPATSDLPAFSPVITPVHAPIEGHASTPLPSTGTSPQSPVQKHVRAHGQLGSVFRDSGLGILTPISPGGDQSQARSSITQSDVSHVQDPAQSQEEEGYFDCKPGQVEQPSVLAASLDSGEPAKVPTEVMNNNEKLVINAEEQPVAPVASDTSPTGPASRVDEQLPEDVQVSYVSAGHSEELSPQQESVSSAFDPTNVHPSQEEPGSDAASKISTVIKDTTMNGYASTSVTPDAGTYLNLDPVADQILQAPWDASVSPADQTSSEASAIPSKVEEHAAKAHTSAVVDPVTDLLPQPITIEGNGMVDGEPTTFGSARLSAVEKGSASASPLCSDLSPPPQSQPIPPGEDVVLGCALLLQEPISPPMAMTPDVAEKPSTNLQIPSSVNPVASTPPSTTPIDVHVEPPVPPPSPPSITIIPEAREVEGRKDPITSPAAGDVVTQSDLLLTGASPKEDKVILEGTRSTRTPFPKLPPSPSADGVTITETIAGSTLTAGRNVNVSTAGRDVYVYNGIDKDSDKDFLSWLSELDSKAIQSATYEKVAPGTGTWFLDKPIFKQWLVSDDGTIWGTGEAGAGKTCLSSVIIKSLEESAVHNPSTTVIYVYCRYEDRLEKTRIFAALLRQLVENSEAVRKNVKDKLYTPNLRRPQILSYSQIRDAILAALKVFTRVYIVLDALDELETRVRYDVVNTFKEHFKTPILFTSRATDLPHRKTPDFDIRVPTRDFDAFIRHEILRGPLHSDLTQRSDSSEIMNEVVMKVEEKCGGLFLLAAHQVTSLAQAMTISELQFIARALPERKTTDDLYWAILKRIQDQSDNQRVLALRLIGWVAYATRPLTIPELREALAVEPGTTSVDWDNALVADNRLTTACHGLLSCDKGSNIVRFIHVTAQIFFDGKVELLDDVFKPTPYSYMADVCATYMKVVIQREGSQDSEDALRHGFSTRVFLEHACRYLGSYMCSTPAREELQSHAVPVIPEALLQLSHIPLLTELTDVKTSNIDQGNLSHFAALNGLTSVLQWALHSASNPSAADLVNLQSITGMTPLFYAGIGGHIPCLKLLLSEKTIDIHHKDGSERTALFAAHAHGQEEALQVFRADLERRKAQTVSPE